MNMDNEPVKPTGLATAVQEAVDNTAKRLSITDLHGSEILEIVSAFYVLQDLGVDADDAATIAPDVVTGGAGDGGVDAIMLLVDGQHLRPEHGFERVVQILDENPDASIDIIFIQATGIMPGQRNGATITDKLAKLNQGTLSVLQNTPDGLNAQLQAWCGFIALLFDDLQQEKRSHVCNIVVRLVWPRPIGWQDVHNGHVTVLRQNIGNLAIAKGLDLKLDFEYLDEHRFTEMIAGYQNTVRGILDASNLHKDQDGATEAVKTEFFAGVVSAENFLQLVAVRKDGAWKPKPHLFHDNVRAFLGAGKIVNRNIAETLKDSVGRKQFRNRNNGVTIVANRADLVDNDGTQQIELLNYSIVNGCQTSFMLASCLSPHDLGALQDVRVPLRIIISEDRDEIDRAILALNSQTAIDRIQVFSRRQYVINLSVMFNVRNRKAAKADQISFERRTNEHGSASSGQRSDGVIALKELMYGYASLFLGKTHEGIAQNQLIKAAEESKIFSNRHLDGFYHLAGLIILRARFAMNKNVFGMKPLQQNFAGRGQLYAAIRMLAEKKLGVKLLDARQGHNAELYLKSMIDLLKDNKQSQQISKSALKIVKDGLTKAKDEKGKPLKGDDGTKAGQPRFTGYVKSRVNSTKV